MTPETLKKGSVFERRNEEIRMHLVTTSKESEICFCYHNVFFYQKKNWEENGVRSQTHRKYTSSDFTVQSNRVL